MVRTMFREMTSVISTPTISRRLVARRQNVFQLFQPLFTLLSIEAIFVEPEIVPTVTIFKFIPPTTLQKFYDCFADDEGSSFSKGYEPDDTLTEGVGNRNEM